MPVIQLYNMQLVASNCQPPVLCISHLTPIVQLADTILEAAQNLILSVIGIYNESAFFLVGSYVVAEEKFRGTGLFKGHILPLSS